MITPSKTCFGFACPVCGELQIQEISAFSLAGDFRIKCNECGRVFAEFAAEDDRYTVHALCVDCLMSHSFAIKRGAFFLSRRSVFSCPQTDEFLFVLGTKENADKALDENFYMD